MSKPDQNQSSVPSEKHEFRATASLDSLRKRAQILVEIRQFFHQHQYWEVETPLLSGESVIDRHLEPFAVSSGIQSSGEDVEKRYLQTSPELGMKRLLACGADRIYQICKAFRREEQGPYHNPEFTILEWYACNQTDQLQMDFTEKLVQHLFNKFEQPLPDPFTRMTYEQAFREVLGVSIYDLNAQELKELARSHGLCFAGESTEENDDDHSSESDLWLNLLLAELVEPYLKKQQAVFLYDYPASQAALAKISETDSRVAKRFELYLQGIEICNGYYELTDAVELKQRSEQQNELRLADDLPQLPLPNRFLAAMKSGLPECSGVALGVDRLVMLLLNHQSLPEVLTFPDPIA